jgi:bacterioferritin (cytochrome b1)
LKKFEGTNIPKCVNYANLFESYVIPALLQWTKFVYLKFICKMISNNNIKELKALRKLNFALKLSREVYNQRTIDLLTRIHTKKEGHINWAEIQRELIDQMGMENYLVCKLRTR